MALILSLLWPGAGHVYAGRRKRGIFFALLTIIALLPPLYFLFAVDAKTSASFLIPAPILLVLYALLAVEAYGHARQHNLRYDFKDPLSSKWLPVVALALVYAGIVVIVSDRLSRYTAENIALPFMIGSHSMEPNFTTGELYLLDKRVYQHASPQRGDVVLFSLPGVFGDDFVKRVVGLGGERVEIKSGTIKIDGRAVTIPGAEGIDYLNKGLFTDPRMVINIPENEYFMLGDNSPTSIDSRYWGTVSKEFIHGKVLPIAGPWNKRGAWLKGKVDDFWGGMGQKEK